MFTAHPSRPGIAVEEKQALTPLIDEVEELLSRLAEKVALAANNSLEDNPVYMMSQLIAMSIMIGQKILGKDVVRLKQILRENHEKTKQF